MSQKISYTWLTRRARNIQMFYNADRSIPLVSRREALESAWMDWCIFNPEHMGCDF